MNINKLYEMCENLTHLTLFVIHFDERYAKPKQCTYLTFPVEFLEMDIEYFNLQGDTCHIFY